MGLVFAAVGAASVVLLASLVREPPAAAGDATPAHRAYLPLVSKFVQPNFLIIISDDQRHDTMSAMPITQARIFDRGVAFANAFATTPLCCPSRSSILTGLYALHHGVYLNTSPLSAATFVERLHDAGYTTGIVGKYLNSWDGARRPEFDRWVVFAGRGSAGRYFNPTLNVDGQWLPHGGYITHILRDYALGFLDAASRSSRPFMLIFAPNAPHDPADPAPGDESLYPNLPPYRPPSFMEADMTDKPNWMRTLPVTDPSVIDAFRRRQLQSLHALDLAIGDLLDALDAYGLTDNTVIVYLSDNGVFWGEHRLHGKVYAYDEAARVPFAIRHDALIEHPRLESKLVANVDLAPTIYELAGLSAPAEVDGQSLMPLLRGQATPWRDALLIEGWGYYPYMAIRTGQFLYIETDGDLDELYATLDDPHQTANQIDNPTYAPVVAYLRSLLAAYRAQARAIPGFWLFPRVQDVFGLTD